METNLNTEVTNTTKEPSQFLTLKEARIWVHEYDNGGEEDKLVDENLTQLIQFAESYVVTGIGTWVLNNPTDDVKSKVRFVMQAVIEEAYDTRGFTREFAITRTYNLNHLVASTMNQLNAMNPAYIPVSEGGTWVSPYEYL